MVFPAMRTTIDAAGRIVVPKPVRDAMGLSAGRQVDLVFADGRIEIELAPLEVTIEQRGRIPVAIAPADHPPLTDDEVSATLDAVRR